MLEKKQPHACARELFTPNSEEDQTGILKDHYGDVDPSFMSTDEEHQSYPSKFLAQLIIVIGCLIITLIITRGHSRPSAWTRARIHTAINASEQSTFGHLYNSRFFQAIVTNGKNLIRLEEITQKIIDPTRYASSGLPITGVQPVQGQISRGFGPQINPLDGQQQYSTGVEWLTLPGTEVLAMADGRVASVVAANSNGAGGEGGVITIDHGSGINAIYYSLTGIRLNPGAQVKKGAILGQTLSSEFFLEVKRNGLLIDPLTLILK